MNKQAEGKTLVLEMVGFLVMLFGACMMDSEKLLVPVLVIAIGIGMIVAGMAWDRWWNG
jgi:hypothetical protein